MLKTQTAQRFTWLLGDVGELDPECVKPLARILFDLRDQMPFPGMQRTVAKAMMLMNFDVDFEHEAIEQMLTWIRAKDACIGSKSYSGHALFALVQQGRLSADRLRRALMTQLDGEHPSYSKRVKKMIERIDGLPS